MPEPVCKSQLSGGYKVVFATPLIEYFVRNTVVGEIKCEVNPPALASRRQK